MKKPTPYVLKLFIISMLLYGLIFTSLMAMVETEEFSLFRSTLYFLFYGSIMSFSSIYLEIKSLQKIGVNTIDKDTLDKNQERRIETSFNKEAFYNFLNSSLKYKVTNNTNGSFTVVKRHYTFEFKAKIKVTYIEGKQPIIILKSIPNKWSYNNLALIHKTINALKEYILTEEKSLLVGL